MQQLGGLFVDGNPLTTLVLSEPLAATNLAGTVTALRDHGVFVFLYPLAIELTAPRLTARKFEFALTGPPGVYVVLVSTNLGAWSELGAVTNRFGTTEASDAQSNPSARKFYRALLQSPPANMVFIPPNTFAMGTPTNEANRQADEGPQTTVTISHGFWIGTSGY